MIKEPDAMRYYGVAVLYAVAGYLLGLAGVIPDIVLVWI
jgi:hypothetical protein